MRKILFILVLLVASAIGYSNNNTTNYDEQRGYAHVKASDLVGTEFNNDVKKMSNVKTPVKAKDDECLEVGTGNNTNGEIGITIKTGGLCKQVWGLPGLVDVKALIESTTDNKTANSLKFGGMGIKYK